VSEPAKSIVNGGPTSRPWLPASISGRFMLVVEIGSVQIFQSHETQKYAEAAYQALHNVESAEIWPQSGRAILLK